MPLKYLDLRDCRPGEHGLRHGYVIGQMLANNVYLTHLDVSNNLLGAQDVEDHVQRVQVRDDELRERLQPPK